MGLGSAKPWYTRQKPRKVKEVKSAGVQHMKPRLTSQANPLGWSTFSPAYYRAAFGGYVDNWTAGHRPGSQAPSNPKEDHIMASKTANKVAAATAAEAAATASTKGKAKTPVAVTKSEATPKVAIAPLSDAELAKLQKAKDAETDPKERGVLRRKLRAALKVRGEYVPRGERPKADKPSKTKQAAPAVTKNKKSKS